MARLVLRNLDFTTRMSVCSVHTSVTDVGLSRNGHGQDHPRTALNQSIISLLTYDKTHMLTLNTELQYKKSIALGWVGLDGVGFGHKTVI